MNLPTVQPDIVPAKNLTLDTCPSPAPICMCALLIFRVEVLCNIAFTHANTHEHVQSHKYQLLESVT